MRHGYTALGAFGPKPNEGHPVNAVCLHGQQQQSLAQVLDRRVHWPVRKDEASPAIQMGSLNMSPDIHMHQRPQEVVRVSQRPLPSVQGAVMKAFCVTLQTKVIDNISRSKWQNRIRTVGCYVSKGVVKDTIGPTRPKT